MKLLEYKLKDYLNVLAKARPVPGGGSASALVLSLGLSLFSMCLGYSKSRFRAKQYQESKQNLKKLLEQSLELIDRDKEAYKMVKKAFKLPQNTKKEKEKRKEEIEASLKEATLVPLEVVRIAKEGLSWGKEFRKFCNKNLISDLHVGITFLESAYLAGNEFIDSNLKLLKDENFIIKVREILELLSREVENLHEELKKE